MNTSSPDGELVSPSGAPRSPLISIQAVEKVFGATRALSGVTFDVFPGETVGLLGANGAGKSTLIKALAGIHRPTSGHIEVEGVRKDFQFPDDARNAGIATVHQNIDDGVVFGMSVAENLLLDEIATPGGRIFWNTRAIKTRAREVQRRLELDLPLDEPVENLTPSRRQEVAIARELAKSPKLLILDEPTSTLSERESEKLFEAVREFRRKGIAVLYISHRMSEIELLCDRAVVLRDGAIVSTHDAPMDRKAIASSILGELVIAAEHTVREGGYNAVNVRDLRANPDGPKVSFSVRRGEVLGLTGLIGAGKSEILEQITGHRTLTEGRIEIEGQEISVTGVGDAMAQGIVMVPEERALQSIFPGNPVWHHCTIGLLGAFSNLGFMNRTREIGYAQDVIRDFKVKTSGAHADIADLSGGNQQKLLVGRWMQQQWQLLILDEPFRGIDIGARGLISEALRRYSENVPVIVCSSDPEEVVEVADRVLIMVDGGIAHDGPADALNAEELADIMSRENTAISNTQMERSAQ